MSEELHKMLKTASTNLKKHYILFMFACLFVAVLGMDFNGTLDGINGQYTDFGLIKADARDTISSAVLSNREVFGRENGVMAQIVRSFNTDGISASVTKIAGRFTENQDIINALCLIAIALLAALTEYLIFIPMKVSIIRVFLENRIYKKVELSRFLFVVRTKKWFKVAWANFVAQFFWFLWLLTIVGGIIKHYSYFMVPYITAENPDVGAKQAIRLSKKMMNGHKFECFKRELMYMWYQILKYIPAIPAFSFFRNELVLGIYAAAISLNYVLIINPLKYSFFTEYYADIRRQYLEKYGETDEDALVLNDIYLYEKAPEEALRESYPDIDEAKAFLETPAIEQKGFRGFIAKNLSVVIVEDEASRDFAKRQVAKLKVARMEEELEGDEYPARIAPHATGINRAWVDRLNYDRQYMLSHLVIMFFICSFIGWSWEVLLHVFQKWEFVNRGTMYGPWLPIYGTGGVIVLMLLTGLRNKPVVAFVTTIILCGVIEYFTGFYLETVKGAKWWDYEGYFLNLHGRICGEGLLMFGIGGIAFIYVLAPLFDNILKRYDRRKLRVIACVLAALFLVDLIYSSINPHAGEGITSASVDIETQVQKEPIEI